MIVIDKKDHNTLKRQTVLSVHLKKYPFSANKTGTDS